MTDRLTDAELDNVDAHVAQARKAYWRRSSDRGRCLMTADTEQVAALVSEVREHRAAMALTDEDVEHIFDVLAEVGPWEDAGDIDGDGTEASIIADCIRTVARPEPWTTYDEDGKRWRVDSGFRSYDDSPLQANLYPEETDRD